MKLMLRFFQEKVRNQKKCFFLIFFTFLLGLLLGVVLPKIDFKIEDKADQLVSPAQTNPTAPPEKKKDGFARITHSQEVKDNFEIFLLKGSDLKDNSPEVLHALYFPKGQEIVVPSLLSDYTFFSLHNFHWSFQYYSIGGTPFTKTIYGEPTADETEKLELSYYQTENDIWAIARLKGEKFNEFSLGAGLIFHAKTKEKLDEFIDLVEKHLQVDEYQGRTDPSGTIVPKRNQFRPNYLEATGKYRFFLPSGYRLKKLEDSETRRTLNFIGPQGEEICLALKGSYAGDVCGFSTSGCTCCNTGCYLVDIAFFADPAGNLRLSGVLDKGGGEGWIRFLYNEDEFSHPWLYYSASYSSGMMGFPVELNYQNYKQGVLNFLYLVESIERTY